MNDTAQWWVLGAAVAAQYLLMVMALVSSTLTAHGFYLTSTATVSTATGALLSAGSAWAALAGLVAALLALAARTEGARRRRHHFLIRQLHTLEGWTRS